MPAELYTNILYPLQDQVLSVLKDSPCYLTGDTALSRGYYQHRYSDDLDLFVNGHNSLANKLSALVDRAHPKDVVDIYFLLKDGLSLKQALTDSDSKAAGITPLLIARILGEYCYERLSSVKWITPPDLAAISDYLIALAIAIVEGNDSLIMAG